MTFTIKICGLTRIEDVRAAVASGATALGFVFVRGPRQATVELTRDVAQEFSQIQRVAVVQNQSIETLMALVDSSQVTAVQLHGRESIEFARALRSSLNQRFHSTGSNSNASIQLIRALDADNQLIPETVAEWSRVVDTLLFDSPRAVAPLLKRDLLNTALVSRLLRSEGELNGRRHPADFWFAGGLTPVNVASVVQELRLAGVKVGGVDVSSGVEREPGHKDYKKLKEFILETQGALRATE